ncbi:MAG: metal-dependent transcriptional regulator [Armatimonadota bacterium]|nr:metal-dependent transcriptional regulator [bacterium]
MAEVGSRLSRSLEDYLEAIYNLKLRSQVARVKDIAHVMDVKMPSVTEAIRSLAAKGLVKHEPYENVELTDEGLDQARDIAHRHSAVKSFLTSVLDLSEEESESEACGIEHAIRPDTLDRLLKYADFVRACGQNKALRLDHFLHYIRHGQYPDGCGSHPHDDANHSHKTAPAAVAIESTRLSDVTPGTKGRIAFVSGHGPIRKRLMEMGLTPDARFEVVRVAPLGDPIEIKLRGYHLSLRKSEAKYVEVQL